MDIYDIDELGPTTGTVFQIFANNNQAMKINTLFDTGAMKSVMSLEMYKKLKLNDLNTTSIPHIVGASGDSLGVRGKTKCEININGRLFYQTFIVCEHLKRPIILGRDFSIKNCIGISWTKSNTRQLTQNNEVIAETAEYQSTAIASVSLKRNIKVPPRSCAVVDVDINSTGDQSRDHPRSTMVKCKSQHMHIPHDSQPERQTSRCSNTIHHCKLQSS